MSDSLIYRDDIERAGWFATCAVHGETLADAAVWSSRERSPEPRDPRAWEKRAVAWRKTAEERSRRCLAAEAKFDALSKAVEAEMESLRGPGDVGESVARWVRLRAALDTPKGDVWLFDYQGPSDEPPDGLESRISAAIRQERGPRAPAPQVPDCPGYSHLETGENIQPGCTCGHEWTLWKCSHLVPSEELLKSKTWGRCTRDAPDDGLTFNQRSALAALAELEARPPNDGSGVDLRIGHDGGLRIAFETSGEANSRLAKRGDGLRARVKAAIDVNLTTAGPYPRDLEKQLIASLQSALADTGDSDQASDD